MLHIHELGLVRDEATSSAIGLLPPSWRVVAGIPMAERFTDADRSDTFLRCEIDPHVRGIRLLQHEEEGRSMKVSAEDIPKVPLGNKGILIRIRAEDGTNLGKLWIGQAKVRWARGNVPEKNAKTLSVRSFVEYLNELP